MSPRVGKSIAAILREKQIAAVRKEAHLQFTIESRELTRTHSPRPSHEMRSGQTTIEAATAADAISQYVAQSAFELVSLSKPADGRESIATVKKDDTVFLVRVYAA
jgi:hypothetical protein